MSKIDRDELRSMIKLEIKAIMDEDALLRPPTLGEPHYSDYHDDDYDDYDDDCEDEKDNMYRSIGNTMMKIHEGSCGCEGSDNPYEDEREEDFGHDENYRIDNAMQSLANLGGDVDVDFDHDDHKHSSYMARPQLYKIAKYASKLLDMVDENEQLDDWQETKIAQISQMIGSVYHSLDYDEEYDDHDELDVNDLIGMIRTGNL